MNAIELFWQDYLKTLPAGEDPDLLRYTAWSFGNTTELANELGQLVVAGIKTATCSMVSSYEEENEPLPKPGDLSIILDGTGSPLCIIQTTEVQIMPFSQVDERFAYDEGEGDRSYAYWRNAHQHYFSRICEQRGQSLNEDAPLVCERFRLLYQG